MQRSIETLRVLLKDDPRLVDLADSAWGWRSEAVAPTPAFKAAKPVVLSRDAAKVVGDSIGSPTPGDAATTVPWSGVTDKPLTFPPSVHEHLLSEIDASALTLNVLPRRGASGRLVDSGVYDDGFTCNIDRDLQVYPQSGNKAQITVRLAAVAGGTLRWAWGRRDDGLSGAPAGAWVINDDTTARVWGTQTEMTINQDLRVIGAARFNTIALTGLTTNTLPKVDALGQLVTSGVYDDGTTCNVDRLFQLYPQSGNTAQIQVRLATVAGGTLRWAWGRRDDGFSGTPVGAWVINDDVAARVWGTQTKMTVNQNLDVTGTLAITGMTSGRIVRTTTGGALTSDDTFTWATGPLVTIGNNTSTTSRLQINGATNQLKGIRLLSNGVNLWSIVSDSTAQTGSDSGARLAIIANNDAGTEIDRPIEIVRAAGGAIIFNRPVSGFAISGLTLNTLPRANASGNLIDSGVFDDGTTVNVGRAFQVYPTTGNQAQVVVRLAAAAGGTVRWAWGRRDDGLSGSPVGAWVINDDTTARVWGDQNGMTVNQALTVVGKATFAASTTTRAGLNLGGTGVAPTTPVDGDVWRVADQAYIRMGSNTREIILSGPNQTINGLKTFVGTVTSQGRFVSDSSNPVPARLAVLNTPVTATNTTTETTVMTATIAANRPAVGTMLRIRVMFRRDAAGPNATSIRAKFGTTTLALVPFTNIGAGHVNFVDFEIHYRSVGASGTVFASGVTHGSDAGVGSSGTTITTNTTVATTLTVTVQWNSAVVGDTITADMGLVDIVG